ncbi:MAG: hypothetical protein FWG87_11755 [Defluviitaleaceae bacterium]|nr:hypothetical protein [Defluviitaleaceae bacterium]
MDFYKSIKKVCHDKRRFLGKTYNRICRGRIYPSRDYLALRWSACGVV